MTAIAIALGMIALFWIAATNFGADSGSSADAASADAPSERPVSDSLTDGTPPTADGSTDQSEFSSAKK